MEQLYMYALMGHLLHKIQLLCDNKHEKHIESIGVSRVLSSMHASYDILGHPIECSCVNFEDTIRHNSIDGYWLRAWIMFNSQDLLIIPRFENSYEMSDSK